jgi:hypothetical protein
MHDNCNVKERTMMKMEKVVSFEEIYSAAQKAGEAAFHAAAPVPMAVQSSDIGEEFDWEKPYEVVSDGVCGFAWVDVFVDGRSKMAREMMKFGLSSNYMGGYNFWADKCAPSSRSSQSMQRKEAACQAFAAVMREHGFKAYAGSRMD